MTNVNDDHPDRTEGSDLTKGEAVQSGETPSRPRLTKRIGIVVAAFLVFLLAIAAFAVPALRMGGDSGSTPDDVLPLWPSQSLDELASLQQRADDGNAEWALGPEGVVEQFGHEILGWKSVTVYPAICDVSGSPLPEASSVGSGVAAVCLPPQSPAPDVPATGEFRSFQIYFCDSGTPRQCYDNGEVVGVFQPLGQGSGHIWAVSSAVYRKANLSVGAGQTVHSGADVHGDTTFNGYTPTLAFASCDQDAATSARVVSQASEADYITYRVDLTLHVDLEATTSCTGMQPGYVWFALDSFSYAADGRISTDPMRRQNGPPMIGLTVVPIVTVFPESGAVSTTSPTTSSDWTTYADSLGWSVDVPPGWTVDAYPGSGAAFAGDGVNLSISRGGPEGDDSHFPLDPAAFYQKGGSIYGVFTNDGVPFTFLVLEPQQSVDPAQRTLIDRMIQSISFAPST